MSQQQALTRENVQNSYVVNAFDLGHNANYFICAIVLVALVLLEKRSRRGNGTAQETMHVGEYLGKI